jgi:hypothetical protein
VVTVENVSPSCGSSMRVEVIVERQERTVFISLCRLFPFHKILAELICPGKVVHHYTDDSN